MKEKKNFNAINNFNDKTIQFTFGENKQAIVTLAERLIVTDMEVMRSGTWFAVAKYNGTNASQITQVVYMVNPFEKNLINSSPFL